ncbi:hypothetical protein HDU92_000142 [Lobulomyces angularis]|nr:hypothetical protein HDU92_000142 [Lobulomyces angularis]
MLTALHDCLDALAEETRNTERWRLKYEKYQKFVEKNYELKFKSASSFNNLSDINNQIDLQKRNKILSCLKFPSVNESVHKNILKLSKIKNNNKFGFLNEDDFNLEKESEKNFSRPKYIPESERNIVKEALVIKKS